MLINETPPNIRRIDTDREDAFAFEITGEIQAADVENIYGLLEGAYELHDKIDLIVIFDNYEGTEWNAVWSGNTMRGKARALKHIRKYAVVGGPGWIQPMMSVFKPLLSVEMKHFEDDDTEAAWEWIGAKPKPQA